MPRVGERADPEGREARRWVRGEAVAAGERRGRRGVGEMRRYWSGSKGPEREYSKERCGAISFLYSNLSPI